jgi:hypothetical protein
MPDAQPGSVIVVERLDSGRINQATRVSVTEVGSRPAKITSGTATADDSWLKVLLRETLGPFKLLN